MSNTAKSWDNFRRNTLGGLGRRARWAKASKLSVSFFDTGGEASAESGTINETAAKIGIVTSLRKPRLEEREHFSLSVAESGRDREAGDDARPFFGLEEKAHPTARKPLNAAKNTKKDGRKVIVNTFIFLECMAMPS